VRNHGLSHQLTIWKRDFGTVVELLQSPHEILSRQLMSQLEPNLGTCNEKRGSVQGDPGKAPDQETICRGIADVRCPSTSPCSSEYGIQQHCCAYSDSSSHLYSYDLCAAIGHDTLSGLARGQWGEGEPGKRCKQARRSAAASEHARELSQCAPSAEL
jgi:hypothetical protein